MIARRTEISKLAGALFSLLIENVRLKQELAQVEQALFEQTDENEKLSNLNLQLAMRNAEQAAPRIQASERMAARLSVLSMPANSHN